MIREGSSGQCPHAGLLFEHPFVESLRSLLNIAVLVNTVKPHDNWYHLLNLRMPPLWEEGSVLSSRRDRRQHAVWETV